MALVARAEEQPQETADATARVPSAAARNTTTSSTATRRPPSAALTSRVVRPAERDPLKLRPPLRPALRIECSDVIADLRPLDVDVAVADEDRRADAPGAGPSRPLASAPDRSRRPPLRSRCPGCRPAHPIASTSRGLDARAIAPWDERHPPQLGAVGQRERDHLLSSAGADRGCVRLSVVHRYPVEVLPSRQLGRPPLAPVARSRPMRLVALVDVDVEGRGHHGVTADAVGQDRLIGLPRGSPVWESTAARPAADCTSATARRSARPAPPPRLFGSTADHSVSPRPGVPGLHGDGPVAVRRRSPPRRHRRPPASPW